MATATLSILGLYNADNTIFDNFHLPTDLVSHKDTIVNNLLMECAEFEILYPDSDFMKFAIDNWSAMNVGIWEHLYSTTQYEYDPIANYDRTEHWEDEDKRKIQNDRTPNLKNEVTHGHVITDAQNSYENVGMVDAVKTTNSGKDTTDMSGTDKNIESHSGKVIQDGHTYGNIGVTTTQQMIEQERSVALFNIMEKIIEDFKMRFCLMVY